ncbi:aspartic-type endopeptidase [Niveomyces insectorum RCEF 264]|uniref:Aspartic-type endopeptidase n=1 Tax=Niveomyces insectorum RCEF 264 TaxID=1081102 RepID=A0A167UK18_9HYPO|nr:aspartic-type endopeptidase [Niveomyces insectorum RCEF 264]
MKTVAVLEPLALLAGVASAANVVELGLQRIRVGQPNQPSSISRRATAPSKTYLENLANNVTGGGYYASVTVGTPPQPQLLVIDTGSSDVWVVGHDADLCTNKKEQEQYSDSCGLTYNPEKSSTYQLVSADGFKIQYLDTSSASGDYIRDTFTIGNASLTSLQMGYATETVRGTGIIGVSFASSESSNTTYPNLMEVFVAQGLISTMAFSLYLNDYRSETGSILFGGVDTEKFIGPLVTMPILQTAISGEVSYSTFAVTLNGLIAADGSARRATTIPFTGNQPVPAILDSGTTLSYLPDDLASSLFNAVGAYTDNEETGYTFIDCEAPAAMAVTFELGRKAQITVPASELVLNVFADVQDDIPSNVPFENTCLFGIQSLGDAVSGSPGSEESGDVTEFALLGDTFLRSAYVVYDLTNNQIGLAPANLNSSTSNVVELQASDAGIPTLTGVASQQTTAAGSPSGSGTDSGDDGTVTVTASPTATTGNKNAAGPSAHGPELSVLAVAGVACLFSLVGGALVMA